MNAKIYFKQLLVMVIVFVCSINVNAQKHGWHGFKNAISSVYPNPSTIGDTLVLKVHAAATDTFSVAIFNDADSINLKVNGGKTTLPLLNVGVYHYIVSDTDGKKVSLGSIIVKEPRVRTIVSPNPSTVGDTISIKVEAPASESFTLTIADTGDVVLHTLTVTGGTSLLPQLPVGYYTYSLVNVDGKTVSKGKINVKAPRVLSLVKYNPSTVGDTVSLLVFAGPTEIFTLTIADTGGVVINTLSVHGGANVLPVLPVGVYSYALEDAQGYIVSGGKIIVKAPKIKSFVHPYITHAGDTLSIKIIADATESFTLNIYTFSDSLVQTLTVNGGSNTLPTLASGFYYYELVSIEGYKVSTGKIAILPPKVHTVIAPNPSNAGEATIAVDAEITETFTLNIFDAATLVSTQTITGGITLLPATLDSGIHFYTVVNADGSIVSKGRIMIY
ncbi:T9SS type A sorting domain-containing protein [Sporocytophaga myxococcoides]|uniref:T9SS type A sorting domain-containing protein n=1 Tax=Sporocytophaga myxococcoides TaxID=153721 RepID=UPI000401EEA5|nr:T9SS type A sorting domain-containing protein [Sporocytophaga myxococcoides]